MVAELALVFTPFSPSWKAEELMTKADPPPLMAKPAPKAEAPVKVEVLIVKGPDPP